MQLAQLTDIAQPAIQPLLMARLSRHPQTWCKMLMPHTQYDALEAHRNAWCALGISSDKETKPGGGDGNKDKEKRDPEDPNNIEERVC